MRRFVYRLDPLIQYRDHQLTETRAGLAEALSAQRVAETQLNQTRLAERLARNALSEPASPDDLIWHRQQGERHQQNLQRRATLQEGQCARAAARVEAARQEVVRARQEVEQLSRHREACHDSWAQNLRRQLAGQLDEIAGQRHHATQRGRP